MQSIVSIQNEKVRKNKTKSINNINFISDNNKYNKFNKDLNNNKSKRNN